MVVIPGKEDRPTNLSIVLPDSVQPSADYCTPDQRYSRPSDPRRIRHFLYPPFLLSPMDNNCPGKRGTTLNNSFNHVDSSNYERLLIQLISIRYYQHCFEEGNATVSCGIKLFEKGYFKIVVKSEEMFRME